jgi:ferric-dicitrate binding protein FerR (iron transport regulator)
MSQDCARWTELSDQQALEQTLPEHACEFLRGHSQACGHCARTAAIFCSLRIPVDSDEVPSEREVEDVLRAAAEVAVRKSGAWRRRRVAGAAGAALAMAAGFAAWVGGGDDTAVDDAQSNVVAQKTRAVAALKPLESAESPLPSAEAGCSEILRGVVVCTAAGTALTGKDLESKGRFLQLARGRVVVSLAPQPAGTSFSIVTPAGSVTAVGTVFSVESAEDGTITARVAEGKVVVREKDVPAPRPLRAGESLRLGAAKPSALTAQERERDLSLLPAELRAPHPNESVRSPSASAPASSLEASLQQALALRAQGEFRRAAEVYRKIYEAGPRSAAGGTALVSLGEISLSSLNDPRAALAAFDAYLSLGGALSQEAAFGKIRALRALGRTAEERTAIERFVARYPKVPQSRVLRERLHTLGR